MQIGPLYHWSPRERRPNILRRGLLPRQRPTCTNEESNFRQPSVCLSADPRTAWSLSGQIFAKPGSKWDLWVVQLDANDALHTVPCWGDRVLEFRVSNRIPKSRLWWVGERAVPRKKKAR